ncbi:PAS domain-containing protein [Micavibrio aeruginosavorus]|uniref:PAS domain-containing protein n=1 Tax=Micavibrio aeruginosavorus EPB TaxID=349215 RepID=M4VIA4_9BACT|nr:PAS domain-containing protein [Micavibrio aeruginosavorus]AGH98928.1 hypothetical protein A11S_2130 [Micavibrio aeruginosavorus EPB]
MMLDITRKSDDEALAAALNRSRAVIHFDRDGKILWANDNFLTALGYALDEIKDKNHRCLSRTINTSELFGRE